MSFHQSKVVEQASSERALIALMLYQVLLASLYTIEQLFF